jgi:DNA ligase-associated metallophosphoesterase
VSPFPSHPSLSLLPEGAVFLTKSSTLIVADVHLGKSAAFRAKGLPIPEGDNARDFARLLELSRKHHAAHLVIAGDLFHAPSGITPELDYALNVFLHDLAIPVTLVIGNHDLRIPGLAPSLRRVNDLVLEENIRVIHDPAAAKGKFLQISGHLHPVVKIPDAKRTSLRLPCFLHRGNTLVLPAFGSFTGGAIIASTPGDRVFVALRDLVIELPAALIS